MDGGTITIISSRPIGPMDYYNMGRQAAMQEVECLYREALKGPQRKSPSKGKGDVTPSKDAKDPKAKAAELKSMGRGRDTELAHIRPDEAKLLKDNGGRGSRNPQTGLLEFDGDGGDGGGGGGDGDGGSGGGYGGEGGGPAGGEGDGGDGVGGPASYGDFGEGGGWSGDSFGDPSSGPTNSGDLGGDGLSGGAPGASPSGVAAAGGGQPGGGYGGPSAGGASGYGSSLGMAESGPTAAGNVGGLPATYDDPLSTQSQSLAASTGSRAAAGMYGGTGSSDPGAAAAAFGTGENAASPDSGFGKSVADSLASVLGQMGPIGAAFNSNTSAPGMASAFGSMIGGPVGMATSLASLGESVSSFGDGKGFGSIATGYEGGPTNTDAEGGGGDDDMGSIGGDGGVSSAGPSASGDQGGGIDSAFQQIMARPGSRSIAGTPYAPSFGGKESVNPAALSAALGAINRPRPGPGLNFGRTTYL